MHSRVWRDGEVIAQDFPLDDLDRHLATEGEVTWFDVGSPDSATLRTIASELQFDAHAIEDATAAGERPKIQRFRTHFFISVYATALTERDDRAAYDSRLEAHRISIFVLPRGIVTLRRDEDFDLGPVVDAWENNRDLIRHGGVTALIYGLLDAVVDGHFETIQKLDDRIEEVEDQLFDDKISPRQVQEQTYRLRRELVDLRRVVLPMREIVDMLLRHQMLRDDPDARYMDPWWQDLLDHVLREQEWTDSLRDMVSSLFETNLSLQDSRLNIVMKRLAGWGAVFAVPTAVTGWFGMNVPYPGHDAFAGLITAAIMTFGGAIAMYLILKRVDWI